MDQQRKMFEEWLKTDSTLSVDRDDQGYTDLVVTLMWRAWQASLGGIVPCWPNLAAASEDPVFHQARGILGTENVGQDDALRQAVVHVFNTRVHP